MSDRAVLLHRPVEMGSVSTGTMCVVARVDVKLWVGFGLFENCSSFFGTHGTVFCGKCFDHTDGVALSDDAARESFALVGWRGICAMELGCKVFTLACESDFSPTLISLWTSLKCCIIVAGHLSSLQPTENGTVEFMLRTAIVHQPAASNFSLHCLLQDE